MRFSVYVCAFRVRIQKQKYRGSSSWVESSPGIWGRSFSRHSSGKSWDSWRERTETQSYFFTVHCWVLTGCEDSLVFNFTALIILQSKSKHFSTIQLPSGSSDGQEIGMNRNANVLFLRLLVTWHTHLGDKLQHILRGFADSRQSGVGPQGLQPRQQYDKHITCQLHLTFWLQLFCKTYDTTTERTSFCLRYSLDNMQEILINGYCFSNKFYWKLTKNSPPVCILLVCLIWV